MAMLCHLLALFTSFIGPLVIWLVHRDQSRFVDAHGRAVLNFILSMIIYIVGLILLMAAGMLLGREVPMLAIASVCVIYAVVIALSTLSLVVTIVHCIQASQGRYSTYPLAMPLLHYIDPFTESSPTM